MANKLAEMQAVADEISAFIDDVTACEDADQVLRASENLGAVRAKWLAAGRGAFAGMVAAATAIIYEKAGELLESLAEYRAGLQRGTRLDGAIFQDQEKLLWLRRGMA